LSVYVFVEFCFFGI